MSRLTRALAPAALAVALGTAGFAPASVAAASAAAPSRATSVAAAVSPVHQTVVIGRTRQGRPIVAQRLGQPGKPVVVILATIHGNERQQYGVVHSLHTGRPVTGIDLWVVETLNVDGWAHDTRWNAAGVDLNRNFPTAWSPRVTRAGRSAASEPETRAVMAFLDRVDPREVISLHQPLYGVDTYALKDRALATRLAQQTHLPLRSFSCSGGCHGTLTQWFNSHHRGSAITVELEAAPSWARLTAVADGLLRAVGGRR